MNLALSLKPLAAALAGAGLLAATAFATAADDYFDPNLIPGAACGPVVGSPFKPGPWLALAKAETKKAEARQREPRPAPPSTANDTPPLFDGLGTLSHRISTGNGLAQAYFDQGLKLSYAFNHWEARRAFRTAQRLDPQCAMCFWGEALILGPNINAPMDAESVTPAFTAIEQARSLAAKASERERGLIEALAARYSPDPKADRAKLDAAYAEAMGKLAAKYPRDSEINTLYAEALMDTQPWDYWEAGGSKAKGHAQTIVATLERVLKANPNHSGAIHLYIHITEASDRPERAVPYAKKLAGLMPGAGHIVHMPSHTWYRLGRWKESLETNKVATKVDEAYLAKNANEGIYPLGYYPHNVHFVMVSAQMAGDARTALEFADKLDKAVPGQAASAIPLVQPIKAAPYFAYAQFAAPEKILALAQPPADVPYLQAMWHYARGMALVHKSDTEAAGQEAAAIGELARAGKFKDLTDAAIPAPDILEVAQQVLGGRIAQAQGKLDQAEAAFRAAIAAEDKLAYMEPPYWYYPVRQSLGAVLLQQGKLDQAEDAFRASLAKVPNNGWAMWGLKEVYAKRGDAKAVKGLEKKVAEAWLGDRKLLAVNAL